MCISKHQSTGTPLAGTKGLIELLSSNERRKTSGAGLFSILIMESQMSNGKDGVEKSGTGIVQAKVNTGEASMNFRADSVELIVDGKQQVTQLFDLYLPHCGFA
jgi:hypothetical protein